MIGQDSNPYNFYMAIITALYILTEKLILRAKSPKHRKGAYEAGKRRRKRISSPAHQRSSDRVHNLISNNHI